MISQFHDMELAWAAGFIEGESHVGIKRGRKRLDGGRPKVGLLLVASQNERGRLERLHSALGGIGHIRGPYKKSHVWATSCVSANEALELLWPYLGPEYRKRVWKLWREIGRKS